MIVILAGASNVIDALHAFLSEERLTEIQLLLLYLERFDISVLEKTRALEAISWLRHENTRDADHVTWSALASDLATCDNLEHPGYVTYRHLVARLLNFDVLVRDEPRRLGLENQLAVDFVRFALLGGALHDRIEFFGVNELIDLKATAIARKDSHLHAGFDITGACYDSTNRDQVADILGFHISHLHDRFLAELTRDKNRLIVTLKLSRDPFRRISIGSRILTRDQPSIQLDIARHLQVESSLLHDNIEAGLVLLTEIEAGLRHVGIDDFMEHLDICSCIANDSLNESMVAICTKAGN